MSDKGTIALFVFFKAVSLILSVAVLYFALGLLILYVPALDSLWFKIPFWIVFGSIALGRECK